MRLPRRLALTGASTVVAAALASVAGAGVTNQVVISQARAPFPARAYVLTLPSQRQLLPDQVKVLENGQPIENVSVTPAGAAARGQFGVVLVIDTSLSMRGRPIAAALAAAGAFVDQRAPNQSVAIVTFNRTVSVPLPFTADDSAIQGALAKTPKLAEGTHVFDGVSAAIDLLRSSQVSSGSVVVLSDGADTGSKLSSAAVSEAAAAAHVRVFAIGLRSKSFRGDALATLAQGAGGAYAEATSSEDLARIYADLGTQLAREYLVQYRSLANPTTSVRVVMRIEGVRSAARSSYVSPALPTTPTAPFHRSIADEFWSSGSSMVVAALVSSLLLVLGIVVLARPRTQGLRKRVGEFVSIVTQENQSRQGALVTGKVLSSAEKSLARLQWWSRFKGDLELAEIQMPAIHLVAITGMGTLILMWLLTIAGRSPVFSVLAFFVPMMVLLFVRRRVARTRALFAEQLPDNLQVVASALRAGHSLVGALSVVVDDSPEPSRSEFRRVIADEQLGVPLEEALEVVVQRMANRDLEQVALVAALQRQTGGNSAEVLDRVTETIRERSELRRLVKTLTAQGRMARWIISFMPVVLLAVISLLNPRYVEPLFTHTGGRVLLVVCAVMIVTGSLMIKRIVNIKV